MLDVACGAGDVAIGLAKRARAQATRLAIEGCDVSPTAVAYATRRSQHKGVDLRFFEHDVINTPLPAAYDVVVCSLFLHHLEEEQAVRLLGALYAAARSLVIVSDLDRSRMGLLLAWLGTRLLSRSPVVHVDSLRSVRAAFTRKEAVGLAARAGLRSSQLTRHWPCRWRLVAEHRLMTLSRVWDIVVVGAGPAGALAAHGLARAGATVLLVDRSTFPRPKVCGGCLNGRALDAIERSDLAPRLAEAGPGFHDCLRLRAWQAEATVPLPRGLSISRERFDAMLVEAAEAQGARLMLGARASRDGTDEPPVAVTVVTLEEQASHVVVRCRVVVAGYRSGQPIRASPSRAVNPWPRAHG